MHLKVKNVNQAFAQIVAGIFHGSIPTYVTASRAGEVAMIEEPVTVTYEKPVERVLFNAARDANPFFHVYESLWMLAGRRDIAPLDYYSSNYAKQVQDGDNPNANGAYGFRWRHARGSQQALTDEQARAWQVPKGTRIDDTYDRIDQLKILINHLKKNPDSRRAVLSMWNVQDDLLRVDTSKDVCCNTHAYFLIGQGLCKACKGKGEQYACDSFDGEKYAAVCFSCQGKPHDVPRYLNMTVCNRSNDLIWGMLGANVVHFSFLQEYLAAHLELDVGEYHQFTNNLHVYTSRWEPEKLLDRGNRNPNQVYPEIGDRYTEGILIKHFPLVSNPETFDRELPEFVERHSKDSMGHEYKEPFLLHVAQPMSIAFHYYKRKDLFGAIKVAESIQAEDWRIACLGWLERRKK